MFHAGGMRNCRADELEREGHRPFLCPSIWWVFHLQFLTCRPIPQYQSSPNAYLSSPAPLVWLDTSERYFPSSIAAQLVHTTPEINFTPVAGAPSPLTLSNLDSLNSLGGSSIYLTSVDDITKNPAWLTGVKPVGGSSTGAISCAIVVNAHPGSSITDVYYFYFYAYNQGNKVLGIEFGDHVGDWEHTMVRFSNGAPQSIWYSQHSSGEAFTYAATQKSGVRPYAYSARGTHANYAIAGTHDHTIPGFNLPAGPLEDFTSQGTQWDPTLNAYIYSYDAAAGTFTAYNGADLVPWLYYQGQWGDQQYPTSDPRQFEILNQAVLAKYVNGPNGPIFKDLNRTNVCPASVSPCIVRPFLTVKK
jgi:hypothetical protein